MTFHQLHLGAVRAAVAAGAVAATVVGASAVAGCAGWPDPDPQTSVAIDNNYPQSTGNALIVYDAYWLDVSFSGNPVSPGASSATLTAYPTSGSTAYVVLAPGWDPSSSSPPTSFIVMQSRSTYALALGSTLRISVDDAAFEGNCASGSSLTQQQADFLTQIVFPGDFAGITYDASTCMTTAFGNGDANGDAGAD